jgi:cell division protein FtsI (penicillin-binding protein 3)
MGFGTKVGVGLVEESRGRVIKGPWRKARVATVGYGHGIMTTPLQMLALAGAVAKGGQRASPYLVEKVISAASETLYQHQAPEKEALFSEETARTLTRYMIAVTEDDGTAPRAQIDGIEVAGKTGTAEKVDPLTGGYSRDTHLASFVGFAPAQNPRYVAVVMIDEPEHGQHYGGTAAAPAWQKMMKAALAEEGLVIEAESPGQTAKGSGVPDELGRANEAGQKAAMTIEPATEEALARDVVRGVVPDLRGLPARHALMWAERVGLQVRLEGSGRVTAQSPEPGAVPTPDVPLQLILGGEG